MAVKDKEHKVLRTAKWFRKFLDEKIINVSVRSKRSEFEKVFITIEVCAHPRVLDQFMKQSNYLRTIVDKYNVHLNPIIGNDCTGRLLDRIADMTLFVYDVSDPQSLEYLKLRLLLNARQIGKPMAIVGIGLEKRTVNKASDTPSDTCWWLAYQHSCPGSEIIFCDPAQMTAGIFGLYMLCHKEEFKVPAMEICNLEGDPEKDQGANESGGQKKGKPKIKKIKKKNEKYKKKDS
ncbi:unnamed protein product [Rodentolepis nana]|uniref:Ribosomal_L7Ae domain-containing protein n=1 Tax=Rodentolepis nana TaxID=102285 RepID=A0A0R3TSU7_RODNA|nr:unnamed protein product [Rodentolepis nana]